MHFFLCKRLHKENRNVLQYNSIMLNRILGAREGTRGKMSEKSLTGVVLERPREVFTRRFARVDLGIYALREYDLRP